MPDHKKYTALGVCVGRAVFNRKKKGTDSAWGGVSWLIIAALIMPF